jgi:hypothetical protein
VDTACDVEVLPPPQLNVAPVVVDDAVRVTLLTVQFKLPEAVTPALGTVLFCVTVCVAVAVHPFAGSVTVTV